MAGDWSAFLDKLPGYSGFTVLVGTPSALLTGAAGGIETMAYRLSAAPGLLALAALGVAIAGPVRAAGNRAWPVFLIAGCGGALTLSTLRYGHPEDLLATACAIGAVLRARSGRVGWASLLIVLAVVAKQWAVLAILPAAMAAPRGGWRIVAVRRRRHRGCCSGSSSSPRPPACTPRSRTRASSSTRIRSGGRSACPRPRSSSPAGTAPGWARSG